MTKAPAPTTLTLKQLAADLAADHELSRKQAEAVVTSLVDRIAAALTRGERIRMPGLGVLEVRHRAARKGRNPATGEEIDIKASKKIAFRPAKELKEKV